MASNKLLRAYRLYNKKYFDNKLPRDAKVVWEKMDDALLGYQLGDTIAIHAKFRTYNSIWRQTLLHEMAHLALPPNVQHGKKFQNEMRRLANAGAFDNLW